MILSAVLGAGKDSLQQDGLHVRENVMYDDEMTSGPARESGPLWTPGVLQSKQTQAACG